MSANWERGSANAQALLLGDLARENSELDRNAGDVVDMLGERIINLNAQLQSQRQGQKPYQDFLKEKADGEDINVSLEMFGAVRPDILNNDPDASLGTKRVANLKLFAWSEWFHQIMYGQLNLNKAKSPILRGLSDQLSKSDGKLEHPERAISALNDIAARMEFTEDMESGVEWVEDRIHKMAETVEWKKDDPTIPIGASIEQVVPSLVDWESRKDKKYEPFESNFYGINTMAVR